MMTLVEVNETKMWVFHDEEQDMRFEAKITEDTQFELYDGESFMYIQDAKMARTLAEALVEYADKREAMKQ